MRGDDGILQFVRKCLLLFPYSGRRPVMPGHSQSRVSKTDDISEQADQGAKHVAHGSRSGGSALEAGKTMDKNNIDATIAEMSKLGTVSSSDWQSYTWKNELGFPGRISSRL